MPQCQVHDCRLKRGLGAGKGVSFFKIPDGSKPENREIAQKWLHFIGTGHSVDHFEFANHKLVCENHFTPDCFTDDYHIRQCKLFGKTPRHKHVLREGAVPTVVSHRRQKYDHEREQRAKKRTHKKVSHFLSSQI